MSRKAKLILGIVIAVIIAVVGITVSVTVTLDLESKQQLIVKDAAELEKAFAESSDKTVVLAKDITVDGDIEFKALSELDLNGYDIIVKGDLVIKDSSSDGSYKIGKVDENSDGGAVYAENITVNAPGAHIDWSADVSYTGTFDVKTSSTTFVFSGKVLDKDGKNASEADITLSGGGVVIASAAEDVTYNVTVASGLSDGRVENATTADNTLVNVITANNVSVAGKVDVTSSDESVVITAESESEVTVSGTVSSINGASGSKVTIGNGATVSGNVTADSVVNNGVISGNVNADDYSGEGDLDGSLSTETGVAIVTTENGLISALANDSYDTIRLGNNIAVTAIYSDSSESLIPSIAIDRDVTIDLNGKTISVAYDSTKEYKNTIGIFYVNGADVVINGNGGTITAEAGNNNSYGLNIINDGKVTVNGGNYYGALTAFQVTEGMLTVNDGHFDLAPTCKAAVPHYAKYVINCIDKSFNDGTAKIIINGGTFVNFDPSNNPEGTGTSYLADNYKAVAEEKGMETWYVVKVKWADLAAWDGSIDTEGLTKNTDNEAKTVTIETAAQLAAFAQSVNAGTTYKGYTVTLANDINLNGMEWTPIGKNNNDLKFEGVFEGNGRTIYNLKITKGLSNYASNCYVGLFGACTSSAKLQNFTVFNADVKGSLNVAVILGGSGGAEAKINNVHVAGSIKVYGYWYVGAIMGKGYSTIQNCTVIGNSDMASYVEITGGYAGGVVGFMGEGDCRINNCTIKNLYVQGAYNGIGGVSGILHYGNTISGCVLENVVVWQNTDAEEDERIYCGAFAGTFLDNGGLSCPTLKDCSFNGELYSGVEKTDVLEANRYVGSLWYGAEPPATVNIENCTIVIPETE